VPDRAESLPLRGLASALGRGRTALLRATNLQVLAGLAAVWLVFSLWQPGTFSTGGNTLNIARQGSVLVVVALAQMFALLIGGFDISVGANMGFSSVVASRMMIEHGGIAVGVVAGLAVGALIGLVNGLLIGPLRVSPFAATLGMLTFLLGLGNVLSNGQSVGGLPSSFGLVGGADWDHIPSGVVLALAAVGLSWLILNRSRLGLYVYGIGGSRSAARLVGVRVYAYEVAAYVLCGLFASFAGIMLAARLSVGQTESGAGYELLSIAAAVIGGTAIGGGIGRISGVVLGALFIQVLTNGLDVVGIGVYVQGMVTGIVIVLAGVVGLMRNPDFFVRLRALVPSALTSRGHLRGRRWLGSTSHES